jgi:bifunctional DNase/RNase
MLFLLLVVAACACTHSAPKSSANDSVKGEAKVEVTSVGVDQDSGAHFVLLENLSGDRAVPILIGDSEAESITLQMHGLRPPRPLTQDLLRNVIEQTGNHVDRVVITEMRDEVYHAKIVLDGGRHKVDSRPSDAIALAMGTHAPIFVNEKLLTPRSELGISVAATGTPKSARGLGIAVQEPSPTLAGYFQVAPKSAVLVNEVGSSASRAGMKRGDLLTSIDGKTIAGVTDFDREVATLKEGQAVVLQIRRGTSEQSITLEP